MTPTVSVPASGLRSARGWLQHPLVHFGSLGALAGYFLAVSWRRWPDLVIDFGRELYIPWRLSEGAVLYRDVDDFYGPLSQYLNAGLFRLFGPGMMVLVTANLVVFAAILAALFVILRRAWNRTAAMGASIVFVTIFGFSRWSMNGSFNYATPYAHETTHGLLVLLLLTLLLARWYERPSTRLAAIAGLLWGVTLVLKPEIALAGALVTIGAVLMHLRAGGRWRWAWLMA